MVYGSNIQSVDNELASEIRATRYEIRFWALAETNNLDSDKDSPTQFE
jgi:flagellar biosynthesis regulator FlaF